MGKVLKIREVGDPILNKISDEVDIENINEESLEIIEDLKSTLEFGTGLGIAAPQIGINKRIIVVGAKKENIDVMIDDSYDVCKKSSSNGIKTIYFRDKEMKVLEQNENLKEVSNWGEIYRYIKEMQSKWKY